MFKCSISKIWITVRFPSTCENKGQTYKNGLKQLLLRPLFPQLSAHGPQLLKLCS